MPDFGADFAVVDYDCVCVNSGDTIWAIAESINPGIDTRKVVSDILDMNNWDGSPIIHEGDIISVPIYKQI